MSNLLLTVINEQNRQRANRVTNDEIKTVGVDSEWVKEKRLAIQQEFNKKEEQKTELVKMGLVEFLISIVIVGTFTSSLLLGILSLIGISISLIGFILFTILCIFLVSMDKDSQYKIVPVKDNL